MNGRQKPIMASSKKTIGAIKEQTNNHDRWMYAGKVLRDDLTICHYNIADGTIMFTSPALDGGGGNEPNKVNIIDALRDGLKKDGDKVNLVTEGLTTLIQKGDLTVFKRTVFKRMVEDPKLQAQNIFN